MNVGTELMPARWFSALERNNSTQKFAQGLERFGFIVRASGIPVGVTFDENEATADLYREKRWVGVNCAVCHTGAMEVGGKTLLINGNQSLINLQEFEEGLIKSVEATLSDSAKMARFAQSLSETNIPDLNARLQLFPKEFKDGAGNDLNHHYFDKNGAEVRWGPARIDGLGGSTNDLTCHLTPRMGFSSLLDKIFVDSRNCGRSHAPSNLPHLWGFANQDFVQWNGEVHSSLARNMGALMVGYGKNWVEPTLLGIPKVLSTIRVEEVAAIEDLYKKLQPPRWKDFSDLQLAPKLDTLKAENGRHLYEKNCLSCHAVQPALTAQNEYGNSYWNLPIIPIKTLGTDPYYTIDEMNHKTYISPVIAPVFLALFGFSNVQLNGQVPAYAARGILPGAVIANYFRENLVGPSQIQHMLNCRGDKAPPRLDGIKARPLAGVLFTAPYLHNGSVPTIYDLLEKPEKRPTKFYLGCRKYDLEKFGFNCGPADTNAFEFDTSRQGNGNSGHDYGTTLTDFEKTDLVEYLKSIEQPAYAAGNASCN